MARNSDNHHPVPGIFTLPTSSATLMALFVCGAPSCGASADADISPTGTTGSLEIDDRPDTLEAKRFPEIARRRVADDTE